MTAIRERLVTFREFQTDLWSGRHTRVSIATTVTRISLSVDEARIAIAATRNKLTTKHDSVRKKFNLRDMAKAV